MSGVVVESDRALSTLPETDSAPDAGIRVRFALERMAAPAAWLLVRSFPGEERAWLSTARVDGGYLLRVHELADFRVDAGGGEIVCSPEPACDPATLEQLLVDQILPQVLHLRGRFSLHASAIAWTPEQVVAFAGASGAGKSTLAASLAPGRALVSDDCLAVVPTSTALVVHRSYPSARLCRDSAGALLADVAALDLASPRTAKLRMELPRSGDELRLHRLYVLEEHDGAPRIVRLGRRDAVLRLANFVHRLDPEDRTRLRSELDFLEEVAKRVRVSCLGYRRRFEDLPQVRAAIEEDIASS